ncbi:hypothetical protein [Hyphomicrobium sp.]|jgi:hypothetical protein|uniref:hypothetical protein n=1 Tax=Hyphomicrobium sp. TaxID=82 RepID=UPI002D16E487|nr:hypothetical protein [Hyphomicrobium sp.]HVZ05189.1 hypothetical protein [Hyphomicrobium sp.]
MDLEAAHDRNTSADKLIRCGMAFCLLVTGCILLGSLAVATPDGQPPNRVSATSL